MCIYGTKAVPQKVIIWPVPPNRQAWPRRHQPGVQAKSDRSPAGNVYTEGLCGKPVVARSDIHWAGEL